MSARLFAALALFLAIPGLALADSVGSAGAIKSLELNTVHADAYLLNHGRIQVVSGKATDEYRWGGSSCGTRTLDDAQVATLQRAMASGMQIQPRYQIGQGSTLCLVGFVVLD
jgi:hypothetical protein